MMLSISIPAIGRTVQINLFEAKMLNTENLLLPNYLGLYKLYGYSWGPRLEYILPQCPADSPQGDNSRLSDILDLLTNNKFRER